MLRKLIAAVLLCFAGMIGQLHAQGSPVLLPGGCGSGKSATDSLAYLTVDSTLKLCVAASVSASITGFPTIQSTGTPIAVTTGGVTGTLPGGAVVVASNVGATNGTYCKLGASATTSDQLIPPNSWFAFTVGANTQLTCITSTSTTTVNMVGGSGLPTGSGGGGGGSGGTSNITQVAGTAVDPTIAATGALAVDTKTTSNLYLAAIAPVPLKALSSEPAAATTTNPVPAMADLVGKQVTSPYANRENMLRCAVTITASTAATTCTGMGAQGASVKIYITDLCITRGDAGTTAITATLNDSATSIVDLPNNGGGGGFCKSYNVPLVIAANTAFQITLGTSITSGHVTASGFNGY